MFPATRLSRLRRNSAFRGILAETKLEIENFIYPIFVEEEINENSPIAALPGQYRIAERNLSAYIKEIKQMGIKSVMLFGVSHHKDSYGSDSLKKDGLLYRMIDICKNSCPEIVVVSDNCFCEYTDHGHCGVIHDGFLDNDKTIENLGKQAVICAQAGADMVAPSAMLDGQIQAIRSALDENNFGHIPIMSYAVKYASAFYGPFRLAADSTIASDPLMPKDRNSYQMNIANQREAIREALLDEAEAADILMVKPAMTSLDILARLKDATTLPLAAYQVSGEYSMIKFAAQAGVIDEKSAIIESLTAIKRAGASIIISYFTPYLSTIL